MGRKAEGRLLASKRSKLRYGWLQRYEARRTPITSEAAVPQRGLRWPDRLATRHSPIAAAIDATTPIDRTTNQSVDCTVRPLQASTRQNRRSVADEPSFAGNSACFPDAVAYPNQRQRRQNAKNEEHAGSRRDPAEPHKGSAKRGGAYSDKRPSQFLPLHIQFLSVRE